MFLGGTKPEGQENLKREKGKGKEQEKRETHRSLIERRRKGAIARSEGLLRLRKKMQITGDGEGKAHPGSSPGKKGTEE